MINTVQVVDSINLELINELLNEYHSGSLVENNHMNKVLPREETVNLIAEIVEPMIGRKLSRGYRGGNFYKHIWSYDLHTDYKTWLDNTLNVVIPLEFVEPQASLVIFDQVWELDSVTWSMNRPVPYLTFNIGVKGCPYEYPVKNLTAQDVDDKFHQTHLSRFPKECCFGLSGEAYLFQPGSMIIFDNRRIHCTSNLPDTLDPWKIGQKTGLSLRYKVLD